MPATEPVFVTSNSIDVVGRHETVSSYVPTILCDSADTVLLPHSIAVAKPVLSTVAILALLEVQVAVLLKVTLPSLNQRTQGQEFCSLANLRNDWIAGNYRDRLQGLGSRAQDRQWHLPYSSQVFSRNSGRAASHRRREASTGDVSNGTVA